MEPLRGSSLPLDLSGEASCSLGDIAKRSPQPGSRIEAEADCLRKVLARIDAAEGTYVRCQGNALIVGRPEALGPNGEVADDDRLKLKPLGLGRYGVWASLSNGRYQFTQIEEDLEDLGPHLEESLLHYLSAWTSPPKPEKPRRGTSGMRH